MHYVSIGQGGGNTDQANSGEATDSPSQTDMPGSGNNNNTAAPAPASTPAPTPEPTFPPSNSSNDGGDKAANKLSIAINKITASNIGQVVNEFSSDKSADLLASISDDVVCSQLLYHKALE